MRASFRPDDGRPKAVLITPPVYDFAFYDLFSKPYGLLTVGNRLRTAGYDVTHINALDPYDPESTKLLGEVKRRRNGTGHLFRTPVPWPAGRSPIPRRYSRYGIVESSLASRIRAAVAGAPGTSSSGVDRPADIVMIATGMTYWYPGVREVVRIVRDIRPNVPIVAGGVYATLLPEHCRTICGVDHVISGSAWPVLPGLLSSLGLPDSLPPSADGPMPDDPVWRDAGVIRVNNGCPNRCSYCSTRTIHPRFSPGSGEAAFRRMIDIHEIHGTQNFAFYDDALIYPDEDGFPAFLSLVHESRLKLRFFLPNAIHARYMTPSVAQGMRAAGFAEVRIGYESRSETFHEDFGVKYDHSSVPDAVRMLTEAGIPGSSITLYVLAGLPGQHPGEVEESLGYAIGLGVRVEIAEFSPVPGSALWERCVAESGFPLEDEPVYQNNTVFPMRSRVFTPGDLVDLKKLTVESRRPGTKVIPGA